MLAEEIVNAKPEAEVRVREILGRGDGEAPKMNGVVVGEGVGH